MEHPPPFERPDDTEPAPAPGDVPGPPQRHTPEQRRLLRRVLLGFVVVVVLLPFIGLGGEWAVLLVPALVAATIALRSAIQLRRTVR